MLNCLRRIFMTYLTQIGPYDIFKTNGGELIVMLDTPDGMIRSRQTFNSVEEIEVAVKNKLI